MTDFENAAFSVFVVLLSRAILSFNLNFYIPISKASMDRVLLFDRINSIFIKVDENMHRAQLRDAARSSEFFFRKNVLPPGHSSPTPSISSSSGDSSPEDCSGCRALRRKETRLRNCFPTLPRPVNGGCRGPVEDEYEEMSMDMIMNGKVRNQEFLLLHLTYVCFISIVIVRCISWSTGSCKCLCRHTRC
jgi:glutamate--cysteine ligase catalytic subunit